MRWALLDGLPEDTARAVLARARRRSFARGEVVFHQGDPADTLHLIAKGRFAVRATTPLGDAATFTLLAPGQFFGELALLAREARRTATVSALEQSETLSVSAGELKRLRHEFPAVTEALLGALVEEVERLSSLLVEALYVPADKRVLRRLTEAAASYGSPDQPAIVPLTQEELGELAGPSRATVNRVLREAERKGTLRLTRRRIEVIDPGRML